MRQQEVFKYDIDYEKVNKKAQEIAQELLRNYPGLKYQIVIRYDEGVFIKLYGDEELIRTISNSMKKKELKLLIAGSPVYVIYGGSL